MSNNLLSFLISFFTVLMVLWISRRDEHWVKAILNWFPAILFAYVIPAVITHVANLDLKQGFIHTLSRDWIIPLAILSVMSALPFKQLKIVGFKPILLFVSGSLAIATLPVILVWMSNILIPESRDLFIGESYWKGLVPIVGGWIGGSTSQLVLKEVAGTEEGLFLSILVLDNILVNIWTILMFQLIKRSDSINRRLGIRSGIAKLESLDSGIKKYSKPVSLVIMLPIVILSWWVITSFLWKVILLSLVGLALGNLLKRWDTSWVLKIGGISIIAIMAILGLKLDFSQMSLPWPLVWLVIMWLILHYVIMMITAAVLRLNIAWVPIASMANLGGISTAPAVTSAYKKELMPHAILLAILSMISGTAWGLLTIYLFGLF